MKKYSIHALYVSLFALFIFGFQYPPLQDYPALNYQGFVFNQIVFHQYDFGGFFHFHRYIPPNVISTVIIGFFDILIDPFLSGKIFLFLVAVGLYSGIIRYLKFHLNEDRTSFAAVAFFMTFNLHFLMAYLNFLTGIALAFHAIIFIRQQRYESNILALTIIILLIYLCHFGALAIFFLYFGFYFISEKSYRNLFRIGLAAIPAFILFIQYFLTRKIFEVPDNPWSRSILEILYRKAIIVISPLNPFHIFKSATDIPQFLIVADYIFAAIMFGSAFYILGSTTRKKNYSLEFWLAVFTFSIAFILPYNFGGVSPAGERVVIFSAMNLCILWYRERISIGFRRISLAACIILGISVYSYDITNEVAFNSKITQNDIPNDSTVKSFTRLTSANPFLHLHFYQDIQLKKPYPAFNVGLFDFPGSDTTW
jgi:hypothetical protein